MILKFFTITILLFFLSMGQAMALTDQYTIPVSEFKVPSALNELIQEALQNNNSLKSMHSIAESTRMRADYDGSLSDPKLGISLSNLPVNDMNFTTDPMSQKQIFVSQKLPWPGKRDLKAQSTRLEAKALKHLVRAEKLKLVREVAETYFTLGYLNESLKYNTELSNLLERIINVATSKYSSGRGMQLDIFQAEVELSRIADNTISVKKQIKVTQDKLHSLLNREVFSEVNPPEVPPLFEFTSDENELKHSLLSGNPSIAALKASLEKTKTMATLATKESYPDFDVKITYGQREEDRTGRSLDDFLSLSATVNLPLWKKHRQDSNTASTKARESAALSKLKNLSIALPHETDALASEIKHTIISYRLYEERLIPQSARWATSARSSYEVGAIEFNSMITARIQPLKFELKSKYYLFELYKKRFQLEELTGGSAFDINVSSSDEESE